MYYNGKKVRNLYYNGKCITRLALGKEMTRLVEGDDFVRAEWLVGDGAAYINTKIKIAANDIINSKIIFVNVPQLAYFVYGDKNSDYDAVTMVLFNHSNLEMRPSRTATANAYSTFITPNSPYVINQAFDSININGNVVWTGNNNYRANGYDFEVFSSGGVYIFNGKINYLSIPSKIDLTPCRLLRPIPASLDANGIARNADECGMYDSVSGKFFGNVASGTFTVSDN